MATRPMRFGIQTRQQLVESPQMLDFGRRATAGTTTPLELRSLLPDPRVSRRAVPRGLDHARRPRSGDEAGADRHACQRQYLPHPAFGIDFKTVPARLRCPRYRLAQSALCAPRQSGKPGVRERALCRHRPLMPAILFPYKAWRSACKRAKIPGRRPHDFRRTMARNYRRSGEAEDVIMKIGGWKTRSVFERYNIVSEDDLRRAAERVTFSPNTVRMGQVVAIDSAKKDASA